MYRLWGQSGSTTTRSSSKGTMVVPAKLSCAETAWILQSKDGPNYRKQWAELFTMITLSGSVNPWENYSLVRKHSQFFSFYIAAEQIRVSISGHPHLLPFPQARLPFPHLLYNKSTGGSSSKGNTYSPPNVPSIPPLWVWVRTYFISHLISIYSNLTESNFKRP